MKNIIRTLTVTEVEYIEISSIASQAGNYIIKETFPGKLSETKIKKHLDELNGEPVAIISVNVKRQTFEIDADTFLEYATEVENDSQEG